MSDFDPYMKDGYKLGGQQTLLKSHEETQRKELPPKPGPVGWETDAEWDLEMRCCNITENTPFAEVSKLINDLWQQYCLAAEPKDVDSQVHHSKPVASQNTQIVEDNATEGGAHEKGIEAASKALGHEGVYISDATLKRAIAAYRAALTEKQTDGREGNG